MTLRSLLAICCACAAAALNQTECRVNYANALLALKGSNATALPALQLNATTFLESRADADFQFLPYNAIVMETTEPSVTADVVDFVDVARQLWDAREAFSVCVRTADFSGVLSAAGADTTSFSSPGDDVLLGLLDFYAEEGAVGFFEDSVKALSLTKMRKLLWQHARLNPDFFQPTQAYLLYIIGKAHAQHVQELGATDAGFDEASAFVDQMAALAQQFYRAALSGAERAAADIAAAIFSAVERVW